MNNRTAPIVRAARARPWAFAAMGIAGLALGAWLTPWGFLPVRVLVYRGPDGLAVLAIWAVSLIALGLAGTRLCDEIGARRLATAQVGIGCAIAIAAPVLISSDAIAYAYYGALALVGANPWHPPAAAAAAVPAALSQAMLQLYGDPPVASIYGPAFVALEAFVVWLLHGFPVTAWIFAQRALALGACAAMTLVISPARRVRWALDPFVLFVCAIDAHNDALFLLLVATAQRLDARGPIGSVWGGLSIALGGAIKIVALFGAALRPRLILPTVACVALAVAAAPGVWTLAPHALQASLLLREWDLPVWLIVGARALALVAVVGGAALATRSRGDWAVTGTIGIVAAIPVVHPWYALWIVSATAREGVTARMSTYVAVLEVIAFALYVPAVL